MEHLPVGLVLRSRDPPPRAASGSSAPRGSTSATSGELPEPGTFFTGPRRPHAGRRHARARRRAARVPQRLPSPRLPRRRRARASARRCSARTTPGRTASTARSAPRRAPTRSRGFDKDDLGLRPGRGRHLGAVRLREPGPDAGAARRRARLDAGAGRRARGRRRRRSSSATAGSARSTRTGRSSARTSSSATTARSRIRRFARGDRRLGRRVRARGRRPAYSSQLGADPRRAAATSMRPRRRAAARPVPLPLARASRSTSSRATRTSRSGRSCRSRRAARYRFLDYFFGPDVDQAWIDDLIAFDDQVGSEDRCSSRASSAASPRARSSTGHLLSAQRAADRRTSSS